MWPDVCGPIFLLRQAVRNCGTVFSQCARCVGFGRIYRGCVVSRSLWSWFFTCGRMFFPADMSASTSGAVGCPRKNAPPAGAGGALWTVCRGRTVQRSLRIWLNVGSSSTWGIGQTDEGAVQESRWCGAQLRSARNAIYSAASGTSPDVSSEASAGSASLARNLSKAACKDRVACGEAGVVETTAIA